MAKQTGDGDPTSPAVGVAAGSGGVLLSGAVGACAAATPAVTQDALDLTRLVAGAVYMAQRSTQLQRDVALLPRTRDANLSATFMYDEWPDVQDSNRVRSLQGNDAVALLAHAFRVPYPWHCLCSVPHPSAHTALRPALPPHPRVMRAPWREQGPERLCCTS